METLTHILTSTPFGVLLTAIGVCIFAYAVWNLYRDIGFVFLFISLIPTLLGIGIIEHNRNTSFKESCLAQNGQLAVSIDQKNYCILSK